MEKLALDSAKRGNRNQGLSPDITKEIDAAFAPPDPKSATKTPANTPARPAGGEHPELVLPLQVPGPGGETFSSQYQKAPLPGDSEVTVGRTLDTTPYTWIPQERIHHPQSETNLASTVPEYFSENVLGEAVAAEVKDIAISGMDIDYGKWAEQLARRNKAIGRSYPHLILRNWLFVDLRGLRGPINLPALAERINNSVSEAGRVGREPGARYHRIHFILDTRIVRMP